MVFSSLLFIYLFLPITIILYYSVKNRKFRNIILLVTSLCFYAWGEPIWIVLLLFSSSIDYCHGLYIERFHGTKWAKYGVVSSIILNLSLLIAFKYSAFIYENVNLIFNTSFQIPNITLPIGISFYTFQTISYTVDVYRGEVQAQRKFSTFLLYVSLFPQLVAGPIVRYSDIAIQIENRTTNISQISDGVNRFVIGLGKKVLLANTAGHFATMFMERSSESLTVTEAWFGIVMFTLQIYFDFSGYSDMAIGLGKIFGFEYKENFNYPYVSRSATEFWRRWHISLGSFFRDYVYIPLGGNRKNEFINLMIVWFLTGIWHGASWNFIVWGLYFGILIYLEKKILGRILEKLPRIVSHCYLLVVVIIGWTFFYFTNMIEAFAYLKVLFGFSNQSFVSTELNIIVTNNIFWIVIAILLCTPLIKVIREKVCKGAMYKDCLIIVNIMILILCTAVLVSESYNPFLYFRF
ncbi:MBOAT family O-acyltransferase [Viridibacillus arvi]|uniref:MBOAT family O-acyltransferase n=1 Tax=Viridibacillus arvi TaxID=263475 RepID=UPI003D0395D6